MCNNVIYFRARIASPRDVDFLGKVGTRMTEPADTLPLEAYFSGTEAPISPRQPAKNRTRRRILVALLAVCFIPAVNSAMAADIALSPADIEFGQGSSAVASCDNSVQIAVNSSFSSANNYFGLSSLVLSALDTHACLGKTVTVRAFNGATELNLSGGTDPFLRFTVTQDQGASATRTLSVTGSVNAADVTKVTVETTG